MYVNLFQTTKFEGINGRLTSDTTFAELQPFQLFSQQLRLMHPAGLLYQMWWIQSL
jgi:hypothetical protein